MEAWILITVTIVFPACVTGLLTIYTLRSNREVKESNNKTLEMKRMIGTMDELISGQDELLDVYRNQL